MCRLWNEDVADSTHRGYSASVTLYDRSRIGPLGGHPAPISCILASQWDLHWPLYEIGDCKGESVCAVDVAPAAP